jgi:hypothetical protein
MRDDTYLPGVLPMGELAARRLLQQRILLLDGELDDAVHHPCIARAAFDAFYGTIDEAETTWLGQITQF